MSNRNAGSTLGLAMTSQSNPGTKEGGKPTFWKKNNSVPGSIKPVYGAQHPPRKQEQTSGVTMKAEDRSKVTYKDSFLNFQSNTSDAWDDGDDDLIMMANVQMSLKDVRSTARAVLDNHSRQASSMNGAQRVGGNLSAVPSANSFGVGPGVGIRLSGGWQAPKRTAIRLAQHQVPDRDSIKLEKFKSVMAGPNTDLDELRTLAWSGIPQAVRPMAWKILSGYLPASMERREPTLERKRKEYFSFVEQYYDTRHQEMHQDTFRQIHIDIPRMNPLIPLFQQEVVQEILKDIPRMTSLAHLFQQTVVQEIFERILYIWAIRHPASGYVQGINDLVTPFFVVYLSEYIDNDYELEDCDLNDLPKETLHIIEADSFWCTSKLLDGIQDNYIFAQPGIQFKVNALKELVKRIDSRLHGHLERHSVEYLQFAFRWMNNLLMREIPLRCTIRLWDTYQAEPNGFADFHLYLCAAFLVRFSEAVLSQSDFQGILMLLQNLNTFNWEDAEIGELLAEAYKLKYMFADAPKHLSIKKS